MSFLIKLQISDLQLRKKDISTFKICEIFKNTIFYGIIHLAVTAFSCELFFDKIPSESPSMALRERCG